MFDAVRDESGVRAIHVDDREKPGLRADHRDQVVTTDAGSDGRHAGVGDIKKRCVGAHRLVDVVRHEGRGGQDTTHVTSRLHPTFDVRDGIGGGRTPEVRAGQSLGEGRVSSEVDDRAHTVLVERHGAVQDGVDPRLLEPASDGSRAVADTLHEVLRRRRILLALVVELRLLVLDQSVVPPDRGKSATQTSVPEGLPKSVLGVEVTELRDVGPAGDTPVEGEVQAGVGARREPRCKRHLGRDRVVRDTSRC